MCWSAPVSAAFAATEWAGIAFLVWRNKAFDRAFAIAISPIAAQEALQWLLWEHISLNSASCDRVNLIGSFFIRQITGLVPLGFVWFAQFAQEGSSKRLLARLFLGTTSAFVLLRTAMITYSFSVGPTRCTTIGPGHHQAWAGYLGYFSQIQPLLDIVFFTLYWTLPVAALLLLFRPRLIAALICLISVGTMLPSLFLFSADELGSVWCWACSMLLGVALLSPRFSRKDKR